MDKHGADIGARADRRHDSFGSVGAVGTHRRSTRTRTGEDQPVEVQACLDADLDIAISAVGGHLRRRLVA